MEAFSASLPSSFSLLMLPQFAYKWQNLLHSRPCHTVSIGVEMRTLQHCCRILEIRSHPLLTWVTAQHQESQFPKSAMQKFSNFLSSAPSKETREVPEFGTSTQITTANEHFHIISRTAFLSYSQREPATQILGRSFLVFRQ